MNRLEMISALRAVFAPALVARGFKGPFPHFRRTTNQRVDILTVQFNRHGGSFVLEIAQCDPNGVTTYWVKHIAPTKVRSWDIIYTKRHRLGAIFGQRPGRWFRFDDGTPLQEIAATAASYLDEAEAWWESAAHIAE